MLRFHESEKVLVHRVGTELLDPPPCAVVTRVYQQGQSFIYNYEVQFGTRHARVKDEWLAPNDSVIHEATEYVDLPSS